MTIGERIKAIRGSLSRDKFAPQTGISKTTLVNYETGERNPPSDYLLKILEQYPDISPAWLLAGEGGMKRGEGVITLDGQELTKGVYYPIDLKRLKIVMLGVEAITEEKTFEHYKLIYHQLRPSLIFIAYNYFITDVDLDADTVSRFIKAYLILHSLHKGKSSGATAPRIDLLMETIRKMEEKERLNMAMPDKAKKRPSGEDQAQ